MVTALISYKVNTGVPIGSVTITDGIHDLKIEENGSMPVTLQDQTTPVVIIPLSVLEQSTTVAALVAIGDNTVTLTSVTGITDKKLLTFFCPVAVRFMVARSIGTPVGNVVTLD